MHANVTNFVASSAAITCSSVPSDPSVPSCFRDTACHCWSLPCLIVCVSIFHDDIQLTFHQKCSVMPKMRQFVFSRGYPHTPSSPSTWTPHFIPVMHLWSQTEIVMTRYIEIQFSISIYRIVSSKKISTSSTYHVIFDISRCFWHFRHHIWC